MLQDRLVCGMEEPRIQRRPLAEPDLMFDKAFELASAAETADKNAKNLQSTKSSAVPVNRLNHHQHKGCNPYGENHQVTDCHFKMAKCYKCGKKGQLAHVCRSKTPSKEEQRPRHKLKFCFATHVLTEDSGNYFMYNMTGSPVAVQPLKVTVIVNSANLEMEVDTEASASIISEQPTFNFGHRIEDQNCYQQLLSCALTAESS